MNDTGIHEELNKAWGKHKPSSEYLYVWKCGSVTVDVGRKCLLSFVDNAKQISFISFISLNLEEKIRLLEELPEVKEKIKTFESIKAKERQELEKRGHDAIRKLEDSPG